MKVKKRVLLALGLSAILGLSACEAKTDKVNSVVTVGTEFSTHVETTSVFEDVPETETVTTTMVIETEFDSETTEFDSETTEFDSETTEMTTEKDETPVTSDFIANDIANILAEHGVLNAVESQIQFCKDEASGANGMRTEMGFVTHVGYLNTGTAEFGVLIRQTGESGTEKVIEVLDTVKLSPYNSPANYKFAFDSDISVVNSQGYIDNLYAYEDGFGLGTKKYGCWQDNGMYTFKEVGDNAALDYTCELFEIDDIDVTADPYPCGNCDDCVANEECQSPVDLQFG